MAARSAPPTATAPQPFAPWTQAWGGMDGYAFAQEAMSAWTCACAAWTDYLGRVATSTGPAALFDAGAQLMTDSLDICSRAAAARLKDVGVSTPLLNDA